MGRVDLNWDKEKDNGLGAWIEMLKKSTTSEEGVVAPRKGRVD